MATVQTKIPFSARKKSSLRLVRKSNYEKENCVEESSPKKNPPKLAKEDESKVETFLLKVNSPSKRSYRSCIATSPAADDHEDYTSPAKKERSTPSTLISKLTVSSSPKTSPSSRKELFPKVEEKKDLHEAVRALHSTAPTSLPCRDDKLDELKQFIKRHLTERTSGTLYISGPPGTGKTASLNLLLSDSKLKDGYKVVYINCTSIRSPTALYSRVAEELGLHVAPRTEKKFLAAIEKYITSCNKMVLLVLDELDQLESRSQSLLYTVFEWPSLSKSRLVLVGIANALDLTDRVLPRLQARLQLKPQLLHFPPYTRQQIVEIITQRLAEAGVDKVFPPSALQLLASKVAAVSGDVRRALDMARRVIEVSREQSHKETSSSGNSDATAEVKSSVTVSHVMNVVSNVYSTSQTLNRDSEDDSSESFPLQQKLLLCSVLLHMKQGRTKEITVGKLHEVYCKVCEKRNLVAVDISEFISLTSLVESRGILRLQGKAKNRLSKISLQWDEKEMVSALKDKKLLAAVLEDKFNTAR